MEHWAYFYNEGIALKESGANEESAEHFVKALELEPDLEMPEAWHNAGAALIQIGKKEEAEVYLKKAIELYDLVIESIREADELEGEYEDSLRSLEEEEDEDDGFNPEELFGPGEDDEEELHFFEEIDDEFNGDEPIAAYLFWKACCYALLGNKAGMLTALQESIAEDDWYAIEAQDEEELSAFTEDPAFRQLVDPVAAKISAPEHAHLFDIFERIETKILVGFEDPQEFVEDIVEKVDAEHWPDKTPVTWIRKTARDLHRKRLQEKEAWSHPTDVERLAAAFDKLGDVGIAALHNVSPEDFESVDEIVSELKVLSSSPGLIKGVCFYEEEDVQRLIHEQGGHLSIAFRSTSSDTLEANAEIGKMVQDALTGQGFDVRWDGHPTSKIVITAFWWKKVFISDDDQEKWDPWRLFDRF